MRDSGFGLACPDAWQGVTRHEPVKCNRVNNCAADSSLPVGFAMNDQAKSRERDMLGSPWKTMLFWGIPALLVVIGGSAGPLVRTVLWTAAFAGAGAACLVNAQRCGRRHCFYTGPFLLAAALTSLLYGLQLLPLGPHGWNWIAGCTLVGSILLCCGLEAILGKYVSVKQSSP